MNYKEKIQRITSQGQITLPITWRKKFQVNQIILREKGNKLEIEALDLSKFQKDSEYTVFDAIRDNKGSGIKAQDLLKILPKNNE